MIQKILPKILTILFVVGGVVAGDMLRPSENVKGSQTSSSQSKTKDHGPNAKEEKGHAKKKTKKEAHGKKKSKDDSHGKSKKKKNKKDKGHGKVDNGHGSDNGGREGISYFKFSRQFIVPVMENKRVRSLVILDLNLELAPGIIDSAYSMEPKLRDAITRSILQLSRQPAFKEHLTSPTTFDLLRATVLEAANEVLGEGVNDVLIIDIIQQDQ